MPDSKRKNTPCRVHIILARESPTAVVIRRGPSRRVCTLGWNLRDDTFRTGQWLHGRIFEKRCDVSPDGAYFIYLATNGKWKSETKGSWTAISQTPYLKAIGLWAKGSTYFGGGLFTDNKTYWKNGFHDDEELMAPRGFKEVEEYPWREHYGGECPGVYFVRLQRDGWTLTGHQRIRGGTEWVFEKAIHKGWVLQKTSICTAVKAVGRGSYYDIHMLRKFDGSILLDLPTWQWADWDRHNGRIVWVTAGVLHEAFPGTKGLTNPKALFDFNPLTFEEFRAPY